MESIFKLSVILSVGLFLFSCSKDDDTNKIAIQKHDENRMMMKMHTMMDTMMTTPMPGDPDHHFAKMMQLHHRGAITMADIILSEGKDTTIKRIAQVMRQVQLQEIADLQNFLNSHIPHAVIAEFNMKMDMSMEKMARNADLQIINGNLDHDFATLMIFHHQSAIEMADLVIHYGHEPFIKNMAEMMKTDQEMEIEELQQWLLAHK